MGKGVGRREGRKEGGGVKKRVADREIGKENRERGGKREEHGSKEKETENGTREDKDREGK